MFYYTRVVSKVSFPIFFLGILWTDQREIAVRYNFWVSGNTVKITWQSLHKNVQNTVLKMELPLCVVAPCNVRVGIRFFTIQNKSAVEIHREVCVCHHRISCIDIQLLYTKHTSLLNFNGWFVLGVRKMNNCAHLARRNYMQQKLHFQYCILYIFVMRLPMATYSYRPD